FPIDSLLAVIFQGLRFARMNRNEESKSGPFVNFALDFERAFVTPHNSENRGEPEAAPGEFRGEERIENPSLRVGGHPAARITDLHIYVLAFAQFGSHIRFGEIF